MPTYDFINKETGEITEIAMSMTKLDQYKEEHPELERYFGNQATSATYGKPKSSDGFKEVMSKVQEAHPLANLSRITLCQELERNLTVTVMLLHHYNPCQRR